MIVDVDWSTFARAELQCLGPPLAVASGIVQINTAVSTFQRLVNTLGTPKDTPELREKLLHIGQLVKDTSAKLKQASETDHRVEASKKITDAKPAKDFQAVLKEFQKGQRLAAERETAYTPFVPQAVLPSRYAMEVQHFQVQLYLAIGFGLIFLVMNSNAMPTTDEEHKFCGEKYVANTYFKKHDSLIDSQFEEFIANKIPLGLCKVLLDERYFMPRLLAVRRNLIGEGSHRQLSSSIRIKMQGESISKLPAQSCQIIIVEKLPSGVFADPFELQHLLHRGVFTDVTVLGDTNLELPSFLSNRSVVEIHLDMGYNMSSGGKDELEVNLGLPLHARYAPLGHGFSKVEFVQPDLFMRCGFEGKAFNGSCLFVPTNDDVDYKASPIVWEVPCGNKKHAGVVSAVTFLSAIVSALLIVSTSIYHSHNTIFQ